MHISPILEVNYSFTILIYVWKPFYILALFFLSKSKILLIKKYFFSGQKQIFINKVYKMWKIIFFKLILVLRYIIGFDNNYLFSLLLKFMEKLFDK